MARLDRLPAAKQIAQIAAVIGREFSYTLLMAVGSFSEAQASKGLDQLVTSGLASRRGVPPEAVYTLKHALVQEAAYESLLRSRRAVIHGRIVDVLLAKEPGIEESQPDLLAHHCEQAGRLKKQPHITIVLAGTRSTMGLTTRRASTLGMLFG